MTAEEEFTQELLALKALREANRVVEQEAQLRCEMLYSKWKYPNGATMVATEDSVTWVAE